MVVSMTQDEIIEMARQAGIGWGERLGGMPEFLERFAKLVAQHEREACAKVCEDSVEEAGDELAWQIRARGQA
jgi:hypothetical protein